MGRAHATREQRRDPLESIFRCTLLFGFVFAVAFAVKVAESLDSFYLHRERWIAAASGGEIAVALALLSILTLASGISVALTRRFLLAGRSFGVKNLVSGALVGAIYAGSCAWFFVRGQSAPTLIALVLVVWLAVWYAIASGLNEVLRDRPEGD